MRIYNAALKLARLIHIMLRKMYETPGNCRNILDFWRRPEVIFLYRKITPLYLRKDIERKPEI